MLFFLVRINNKIWKMSKSKSTLSEKCDVKLLMNKYCTINIFSVVLSIKNTPLCVRNTGLDPHLVGARL